MSDNNNEYVSRPELESVDRRLSKEIVENRTHIESHSREIARLEAVYQSLEGLPVTISSLEKTMSVISNNLESMDRSISDVQKNVSEQKQAIKELRAENTRQNDSLERIDSKSKIDVMVLIRDNFWKLLSLVAVGYAVVEIIMKKVGG